MASEPRILIDPSSGSRRNLPDSARAWRWIGWLALALFLAGAVDWVLAWIPLRFGSPEWEFGTVVASFGGLPLMTMGFAGLLASAIARGIRWQVVMISLFVLVWAVWILGALIIFLLDVPIALRASSGPVHLGLMKATARTTTLGLLFSTSYFVAGIAALRQTGSRPRA